MSQLKRLNKDLAQPNKKINTKNHYPQTLGLTWRFNGWNSMLPLPLQGYRFNPWSEMKVPHAAWCGPKQTPPAPPPLPRHLYLVVPSFVEWSVNEISLWKVWDSCFKVCTGSTISSAGKLESFHLEASWTWEKRCSRTNLFLLLININCSSCWGLQMGLAFQISLWAEPPLKRWSSSEGSGFFFFKCSLSINVCLFLCKNENVWQLEKLY